MFPQTPLFEFIFFTVYTLNSSVRLDSVVEPSPQHQQVPLGQPPQENIRRLISDPPELLRRA